MAILVINGSTDNKFFYELIYIMTHIRDITP